MGLSLVTRWLTPSYRDAHAERAVRLGSRVESGLAEVVVSRLPCVEIRRED